MNDKTNIQDDFLTHLYHGRHAVAVYTVNGFKMKGRIMGHDQFTILLEDTYGGQNLVYKSAVSTIALEKPGST